VLRRAGLRSGVVLPLLISGGYRIGSLTIAWDHDHPLTPEEAVLVTAVADATAQAARRAQLYRERRDVAHTLQAAMLPELPPLPGLAVASRYLPWSTTDEQVGGDWYDAISLPDDGVLLVIGDVAGHDTEAAARMGRVRSMFRALAVDRPTESPSALVSRLDHVLDVLQDGTLATMTVVRLDAPGEGRRVRWTSAGHPPAVLVDADDGRSQVLQEDPDLPIGVAPDRPRHDHERPWPVGGTLVLYTDGLVERRGRDLGEGIRVLQAGLERTHTEKLETVLGELVTEHVANSEDDCAVLAVRDLS
jgi:serine phosphatase RsbU (regulator of sigma subunit)